MKSAIAGTVAVVALASAAVSTAGPSAHPQRSARPQASAVDIATLAKKLNQTTARVAQLDARVKKLEKTNKLLISVEVITLAGVACEAALTADAFQTTWSVVDQLAAAQSKVYFGPQTPLNDQKSCSDITVQRQAPFPAPPSLGSLSKLIDFFYGP
jgi:hypothetical protein